MAVGGEQGSRWDQAPVWVADLRGPVCVLSPHLDDAVFSAASLIGAAADVVVVTVFSGGPWRWPPRGWNATTTGEHRPPAALAVRRAEDRAALALLGARPRWLGLWDVEYRPRRPPSRLADTIRLAVEEAAAATVVAPLGIGHHDHRTLAAACRAVLGPDQAWLAYLDLPYGHGSEEEVGRALRSWAAVATPTELAPVDGDTPMKAAAVACYRTQLPWVGIDRPGWQAAAERCWRLEVGHPLQGADQYALARRKTTAGRVRASSTRSRPMVRVVT